MDYRDERNALRARVDSLESELGSARAEAERMRATENALGAAQRENEKLKAEVRRLMPRPPQQRPGRAAAIAAGVIVVASVGAGAFLLLVGSSSKPASVVEGPASRDPATPIARSVEGPAPAAEAEPGARATVVEWPARVVKSEGLAYAPGAACTVRATLRSDGRNAVGPDVEIACGGKWLYRSTDALAGVSAHVHALEEVPGADEGSHRAVMSYEDSGTRTGERTQASVSTFDRVAIAWKDTAPTYRVELAVDELSNVWKGPALFTAHDEQKPEIRTSLQRAGRVTEVSGTPLVTKGDACSIDVRPAWGPENNCRVRVHCGETTLYGTDKGGYNRCAFEGSSILRASDPTPSEKDRDPVLVLDVPGGTVQVSDTLPSPWSVAVRLDPKSR